MTFDDEDVLYDTEGRKSNWWTDNDYEEFIEYTQCFIDEYNVITFETLKWKILMLTGFKHFQKILQIMVV